MLFLVKEDEFRMTDWLQCKAELFSYRLWVKYPYNYWRIATTTTITHKEYLFNESISNESMMVRPLLEVWLQTLMHRSVWLNFPSTVFYLTVRHIELCSSVISHILYSKIRQIFQQCAGVRGNYLTQQIIPFQTCTLYSSVALLYSGLWTFQYMYVRGYLGHCLPKERWSPCIWALEATITVYILHGPISWPIVKGLCSIINMREQSPRS